MNNYTMRLVCTRKSDKVETLNLTLAMGNMSQSAMDRMEKAAVAAYGPNRRGTGPQFNVALFGSQTGNAPLRSDDMGEKEMMEIQASMIQALTAELAYNMGK